MNILITGASKGIGRALALAYSHHNSHKLILVSRDIYQLEQLKLECNSINPSCSVALFPFDLSNITDLDHLYSLVCSETETIDILINNAGILTNKAFEDITLEQASSMLTINFMAPAFLIRTFIPSLKKAQKAHVINIGSMGGFQGSSKYPGLSFYSASKAALAVLTECLAEEFAKSGISFNCLALGAVQTEMLSSAFPGFTAPVTTGQMAQFILEFSLNGHLFMNGKIIPVSLSNPK